MRLTKFGHACVRLEKGGRRILIDPGELTPEAEAWDGVEAVLVTHEHMDHFAPGRLRQAASESPGLAVYTCPGVAAQLADFPGRLEVLPAGDVASVAGFEVAAFGEKHRPNHPDLPPVDNVGFLVDGTLFHPGDQLTVVDAPVLLVPGQAPWMSALDLIGYLRAVRPRKAWAMHDGLLNDFGLRILDATLAGEARRTGAEIRRLAVGETVEV
jgi:L-ascorbate metabolism protein UlaG (beta-lactamase superfamily)